MYSSHAENGAKKWKSKVGGRYQMLKSKILKVELKWSDIAIIGHRKQFGKEGESDLDCRICNLQFSGGAEREILTIYWEENAKIHHWKIMLMISM